MGKHIRRLLKFAINYPGWNSYAWGQRATANAIRVLVGYGFIEVNEHRQFRLVGNAQLFKLIQDTEDMKSSRNTRFVRCPKCLRLHDDGWQCPNCRYEGE